MGVTLVLLLAVVLTLVTFLASADVVVAWHTGRRFLRQIVDHCRHILLLSGSEGVNGDIVVRLLIEPRIPFVVVEAPFIAWGDAEHTASYRFAVY